MTTRASRGIWFLLLALCPLAVAQDLPTGWRRPTTAEAPGDWRLKSRTRFLAVNGDFDGDGRPDFAELLVNPAAKQFALFVKLESTGRWQRVGDQVELQWLDRMGINLVKPGKYKTACGKGYDDSFCAHGEPKFLNLSANAIDMFVQESADSMFYWDPKKKAFQHVEMSD